MKTRDTEMDECFNCQREKKGGIGIGSGNIAY
jgi:hypothetical protein